MKAVVFVDCQNDFVTGALRNEKAIEVMPNIIKFAKECRAKGYALYATADTHGKGYLDTLEGIRLPVEHCIEGTEGHKIVQGLVKDENGNVIIPQGRIVDKETFGSFDLVDLIEEDFVYPSGCHLMPTMCENGNVGEPLDEIVICGFVTSICVLANAVMLRAKFPNTPITVLKDLCAGVTEEDHAAALKVLEMQQIDVR